MNITQEVFDSLMQGLTASEIKMKLSLTDKQWTNLCGTALFKELLHTKTLASNAVKLKEIEIALFSLLEGDRSINVDYRIDSLTARYASFLL